MIHNEQIEIGGKMFCRHWSDKFYIRQVETGKVYLEAVDTLPCRFTYEETDEPLPEPEHQPEAEAEVVE